MSLIFATQLTAVATAGVPTGHEDAFGFEKR
jgi:hypothetical protein